MALSPDTKMKLRRWEVSIGVTFNPFRWRIKTRHSNKEQYWSLWVIFGPINFNAYYDRQLDDF